MKWTKRLLCLIMTIILATGVAMGDAATAPVLAAKKASASAKLKVGKTFTGKTYKFKILTIKGKKGTAAVIGAKSRNITSVVIPKTVKKDGVTFTVTAIADNAFKNYKKLKTAETNSVLTKIGKNAFAGCGKLSAVYMKTTKLESVGKNAFKGIYAKAIIEVPKSRESSYKKKLKNKGQKSTVKLQVVGTAKKEKAKSKTQDAKSSVPAASDTDTANLNSTSSSAKISAAPETEAPQQQAAPASDSAPETTAPETQKQTETPKQPETQKQSETQKQTEAPKQPETQKQPETTHEHSYSGWKLTKAPTCTTEGVETAECSCGAKQTKSVAALGHQLVHHAAVAATCTSAGAGAYDTCTRCSYKTEAAAVPALGHSFTKYNDNNDATCTVDGTETAKCSRCAATDTRTKKGSALGHAIVHHDEKAATCTSTGISAYDTCSRCSYRTAETVLPALGHNYQYKYNNDATCTADGTETGTCTRCGATEKRVKAGSALGHSYDSYIYNNDATCTEDGTETATCSRCKVQTTRKKANSALGHQLVEVIDETASCTHAGRKHQECTRKGCGYVTEKKVIRPLPHTIEKSSYKVISEPTCSEWGLTKAYCSVCNAEENIAVPPTKVHVYEDKYTVDKRPTCTEEGSESRHCATCNLKKDARSIPKLEHKMVQHEAVPATCTTDGMTAYEACDNCGEGTKPRVIRAKGHQWSAYKVVESATCVSAGREERRCQVCGQVQARTIPQIASNGHEWIHYNEVKPTCVKAGRTAYDKCAKCGAYKDGGPQQIPTLQHNWVKMSYGQQSVFNLSDDAGTDGAEIAVSTSCMTQLTGMECSNCSAKIYEVEPHSGHNWNTVAKGENPASDYNSQDWCTEGCFNIHSYAAGKIGEIELKPVSDTTYAPRIVWGAIFLGDSGTDFSACDRYSNHRFTATMSGYAGQFSACYPTTMLWFGQGEPGTHLNQISVPAGEWVDASNGKPLNKAQLDYTDMGKTFILKAMYKAN